ncbi:phenylacetate--CoA ligase family protein [Candidatus Laterigemmans baculatus]|uniref:phenylacetate--CoA ligase family protein n=1 Tax=Candidatus Laterigemmans baculatus TaxID=2770505 RepID=UPI0013DC33CF|nr:AMP-binding protein [Candidatus Laterigemmans baculatus]
MNSHPPQPPSPSTPASRDRWRRADPEQIAAHQVARVNRLLAEVVAQEGFYRRKYHADALQLTEFPKVTELAKITGLPRITELADLRRLPLLEKPELDSADGSPAAFHTYPPGAYVRFHRTSGTRGRPLPVMDTAADWRWWIDTWQYVLDAGQVTPADVAVMAFSFGPFIGFWSANDALVDRGAMVIPAGGMSTAARLALIEQTRATVVCCTPTYAMHLAETAAAEGIDLSGSSVRLLIVAGEPGGSIPEVRQRIETAWGATVLDHSGATELGPWGFGSRDGRGLHVIESEFIAELLIPGTDRPAAEGELAELVLTGLGRLGAPAIRYRTGDLVRGYREHDEQCRFLWLEGGVLGRADDMLVIRGVNIFPTSIEQIVRSLPRLGEFRLIATRRGVMDELEVLVEDPQNDPADLAAAMEQRLGLRIPVRAVAPESLPRFDAKAKRLEDRRHAARGEGSR